VRVERVFVARARDGHAVGLGIQLMLKEHGEIARLHFSQSHVR